MKIELRDITKRYGAVVANDGVSMIIEGGTIHGLLGENGAGKTTLMKILSGYQRCDSGELYLDGRPAHLTSPAEAIRAGIGMLHQDPLDVPHLSVLDNFMLGREGGWRLRREAARRTLGELSRRFGFALDPDADAGTLTVGERQQLELMRLLSLGIRAVILDEPTTGISSPQRALLFESLRLLAAEGFTVIFVSHKLDEIQQLCSRATVLRWGQVAGEVCAPFCADELVALMFGQCLERSPRHQAALGGAALELQDVTIHTYRLSLPGISLSISAGEVLGLAGLEGSGQSLLLRACAGLLPVAAGRVRVAGQDMTGQPYQRFLRAGVAFVPAARLEEGLVAGLTLRVHVALLSNDGRFTGSSPSAPAQAGARSPGKVRDHVVRGAPFADFFIRWPHADARAAELIREFNIIGTPHTAVNELSGGNQQRALLALLPEHLNLLLMEHPTRGLDIESADWIWSRLLQRRDQGTAIIFTSTDLDELVENSDRIAVFSGGTMSQPADASSITCEQLGYLIGGRGS